MKVTQEYINQLMSEAEVEESIFFNKCLVLAFKFKNGFVLTGVGACVDPKNFNLEVGRQVAKEQIADQLWKLEGYLLQQQLAFLSTNFMASEIDE